MELITIGLISLFCLHFTTGKERGTATKEVKLDGKTVAEAKETLEN